HEHEGAEQVGGQADGGNAHHRAAFDGGRIQEPLEGFPEDDARHQKQGCPVGQRRQNFDPVKSVGFPVGSRPRGEPERGEAEQQAGGVAEHVSAVRQKRQAVGQKPAGKFQQHDAAGDAQGQDEGFPVAFPDVVMMVMMVMTVMMVMMTDMMTVMMIVVTAAVGMIMVMMLDGFPGGQDFSSWCTACSMSCLSMVMSWSSLQE